MAFSYARMKATADRLIASAGQEATLRRPVSTGPAHNPTEGTPQDHSVRLVVDEYRQSEIDGTRVLRTDKKILLAKGALTIEPKTSDQLLIGGKAHAIIDVRPTSPGGVVVMWEVQCRG